MCLYKRVQVTVISEPDGHSRVTSNIQ